MAEESDLEKTELPSQRRLDQAREKGQVARSRELSTFADLGTRLYATGATRVSCGALGDHEFHYAFDGWRDH